MRDDPSPDEAPLDAAWILRQVGQRLQDLRRCGVDRVPMSGVTLPPRLASLIATSARLSADAPPTTAGERSPVVEQSLHASSQAPERIEEHSTPAAPTPRTASTPPLNTTLFPAMEPQPRAGGTAFTSPVMPSKTTANSGERAFERAPLPIEQRAAALAVVNQEVIACVRCPVLVESRSRTVFGEGPVNPRLMFVGEAPGADEDRTGRPFVGRAGRLLDDMIVKGMGIQREDVYIGNSNKCRPPENRAPEPAEIAHCRPFLDRQIEILRPEFLCLLGRTAVLSLLETVLPMNRMRQRWHRYRGIPTIVTYHPSYLLRNPAAKKDTWEDLKLLMEAMGLKPPARREDQVT